MNSGKLALLLTLVASAYGATITTSTLCSVNLTTSKGPLSCSVSDATFGNANAQVTAASFTLGTSSFSGTVGIIGAADPPGSGLFFGQAADADVLITDVFSLLGPVRPGLVEITLGAESSRGGNTGGGFSYVGGPYFGGCTVACPNGVIIRPITLGTQFSFTESADGNAEGDGFDFVGDFEIGGTVTFQFLEADGVTPALIAELPSVVAPEPIPQGLCCAGLALLLCGLRRRS
jgi:hypothetical protein